MSVLNYPGLQYFYDNLVTKFADAGALATLQNQTNDISDSLDTLNDLFTTWKEENFSVSGGQTFFEGISKNIEITSRSQLSTSIYLVGPNTTSSTNYSLYSLYSNAYLQHTVSSTASSQGTTTLVLGNSTTSSSAFDSQGQIKLFGPSTSAAILSYEDSTASYVSLPKGGTSSAPAVLALKTEVTDVANNIDTINGTLETLNTSIQDNADDIVTINSDLTTINNTLSSLPNVYATPSYVDGKISDLLGGATEAELNTLKELSDALNDDENFATTVNNAIAAKVSTSTYNTKMSDIDTEITNITTQINDLADTKVSDSTFVSTTVNGIVPKSDASKGTISSATVDWVLTNKNGTIGWYKLPAKAFSDTIYTLPAAGSALGGVKSGGDVTISDGVISVNDDSHNHIMSNIDGLGDALDDRIIATDFKVTLDGTGNTLTGATYSSDTRTITFTTANKNQYSLPTAAQNSLGGVKTTSTVTSTSGLTASPIIDGVVYYKNTTYDNATTSTAGLMSSTDKTKLNNTNIAYATCSTAGDTAAKVATISGNTNWTLSAGSMVSIFFSSTNTASNPTLNVNSTGAKKIYFGASQITTGNLSYAGYASRVLTFMYDGTQYRFVSWGYDTNTFVTQTARTTNGNFPMLLRGTSAGTSTTTNGVTFATAITANPSTGTITATKFVGDGSELTALSAANISAGTLPVGRGGTGATTAKAALTNLGVYYGSTAPSSPQEGMIWLQP